jgi:hypothetical protein
LKPETRNLKPFGWWLLVLLLLLLAFALRIHNLGGQSLWNDEGNSFVQSIRPVPEIISNAARDIHPPGYYLLLAGWRSIFGTSEFGLRSLSLFASLLTVAFTCGIGARLFGRPAGLIATGVVAVNTFSIYYAQETRMYALLGLWSAAAFWVLSAEYRVRSTMYKVQSTEFKVQNSKYRVQGAEYRARWDGSAREPSATSHQLSASSSSPHHPITSSPSSSSLLWILALGLINAAGLYTHYAYPFVMLVQGAVVLVGKFTVHSSQFAVQSEAQSATDGINPVPTASSSPPSASPVTRHSSLSASSPSASSPVTRHSSLSPSSPRPLIPSSPSSSSRHHLVTSSSASTDHQPPATNHFSLITRHSLLLHFTLANLLALLLFAPLAPTAIRQVTTWPGTGQPIPVAEALTIIVGWFSLGITWADLDPVLLQVAQVTAMLGLVGVGVTLWRSKHGLWVLLPLLWVVIPVGLFLLLGLFRPANLKFLLPSQIGFALLIGAAVVSGRALARVRAYAPMIVMALAIIWLGSVTVYSVPLLYDNPRYQRADYRAIAGRIAHDGRLADAVILNAPNQEEVFRYYLMNPMDYDSPFYHYARFQSSVPVYPLPAGLGGDEGATEAAIEAIIEEHRRIFVLFWGEAERDPNRVVERVLDTQTFQAGEDRWYGDVRLAIYTTADRPGPAQRLDADFGDSITLETARMSAGDFALSGLEIRDVVQIELQWSARAVPSAAYKVFVQLLRPDGTLAGQRDSEPVNGTRPTITWAVDEVITDRHGLVLPADLPAGDYTLILGLYDPLTGARLPVGDGDYMELGCITVLQP